MRSGLQRGEELRDHLVDLAALRAAGQTADEDGHHLALVARAAGSQLGDHLAGGLDYLVAAHLGWQVALEDFELRLLLVDQVLTPRLLELGDALPPPLRLAAKDSQDVRIGEGSALLHLGVFDRPDGHAYGDLAGLVALTDLFFEIVRQLLFEGHRACGPASAG